MTQPAKKNLLSRLMGSPKVKPTAFDPADMGTAIGLEYVLDQPTLPAGSRATLDPITGRVVTPTRAAAPPAAGAGWLRRRR
jgi:hypothetical protein